MLAGVVAHSAWIPTSFPVLRRYANRLAMHDNIQLAGAVDVLFLHGALDRQVRAAPTPGPHRILGSDLHFRLT